MVFARSRWRDVSGDSLHISQQPESKSGLRLAAVSAEIVQKGFCPDLEREVGRLFGYDHEDIEYYIQHC